MNNQTIEIPIEDVLDLHNFNPKDISSLLENYILECIKKNISSIRIIHGKGKGILKKRTLAFLDKSPMVLSYSPAPGEAGGWGATIAELNN
ncbi:MAG: Smr/MutS family protein [Deltaproteobacteria bacterium]|nr:Smr/MutS family protein [Deltaproteobacteria bacterium]